MRSGDWKRKWAKQRRSAKREGLWFFPRENRAVFQVIITPATIYVKVVIPAKAGIQNGAGCRIRPAPYLIRGPA
jgi:hypothetical protein